MASKTTANKLLILAALLLGGLLVLGITMYFLTAAEDPPSSEQEGGIEMREDVDEVIFLERDEATGNVEGSQVPSAPEPQD